MAKALKVIVKATINVSGSAIISTPNWWESGGVTGAIAVYQPKGASSLANSYVDLSGNGNDATLGVAPTWDADNGWIFNGSDQYLDTGVVPVIDETWSMIIRYSDSSTSLGNNVLAGCVNSAHGSKRFELSSTWNPLAKHFANNTLGSHSPPEAAGVIAIAGLKGYFDGVEVVSLTAGTPTLGNTRSIYIGATNSGSVALHLSCKIQGIALYDYILSAEQISSLTTNLQVV